MLNKPFLCSIVGTGLPDTLTPVFSWLVDSPLGLTCFITSSAAGWITRYITCWDSMLWECALLTALADTVTEALEQHNSMREQKNATGNVYQPVM